MSASRPSALLAGALLAAALLAGAAPALASGAADQAASPAASLLPAGCVGTEPSAGASPGPDMPTDQGLAAGSASASPAPGVLEACQVTVSSPFPQATAQASAPPPQILVEAHEFGFKPTQLTISAAGPTTLELRDTGVIPHNFTVDALGIQIVAAAGRSVTTTLEDLPPGTYQFYCSISGHRQAGMEGTLVVQ